MCLKDKLAKMDCLLNKPNIGKMKKRPGLGHLKKQLKFRRL